MPFFTAKEMRDFKSNVVNEMIQELKREAEADRIKWQKCKAAINHFKPNGQSMEDFAVTAEFKGSKNPSKIADRLKFVVNAEMFLKNKLSLATQDDWAKDCKAKAHCQMVSFYHEIQVADPIRTRSLLEKWNKANCFRPCGNGLFEVILKNFNLKNHFP